jgi:calcineurin-like phosphoesterase family protein
MRQVILQTRTKPLFLMGFIGIAFILVGCATTPEEPAPVEPTVEAAVATDAPMTIERAAGSVTFAAMGDGPRAQDEEPMFLEQIAGVNADEDVAFLVHVGDITSGTDRLPEAYYIKVANYLRRSERPVFIVPGDNEWNDLDNPALGWTYWERHFLNFERYRRHGYEISRQPEHPANVAWLADGVLMIGLNLVGGTIHDEREWRARHALNAQWVREQLGTRGRDAYAAVVFAQAKPHEKHADFFVPFIETVAEYGQPVLYLHGDGHVWEYEAEWRAPNLTRVQVDQVKRNPPLRVTVSPQGDTFTFDRRLEE